MKTVTLTQIRKDLDKIIEELVRTKEHVTITRYGKPVAVLMPVDEYEEMQKLIKESQNGSKEEA